MHLLLANFINRLENSTSLKNTKLDAVYVWQSLILLSIPVVNLD